MKPDWKDAPEWAKYLAKDLEGDWWWYENEPYKKFLSWHTERGRAMLVLVKDAKNYWYNSLEKRP